MKTALAIVGGANVVGFLLTASMKSEVVTDLIGTGSIGMSATLIQRWNNNASPRSLVSTSAIGLWSLRLSCFLAYRAFYEGDARFTALKMFPPPGQAYLFGNMDRLKNLAFFWVMQAVWGIVMLTPQVFSNPISGNIPTGRNWIGLGIAAIGWLIETVADHQKYMFKRSGGDLCTTGLYSVVQYPNYTGEIMFWTGLGYYYLASFGQHPLRHVLSFLPAAFVSLLLLKVSGIPISERMRAKRYVNSEMYKQYKHAVPKWLIPGLY